MRGCNRPTRSRLRLLAADFNRLGEEVRAVEKAGVDLLHFDVMDGHFVPNISMGVPILQAIRKITKLPLDAHLMISEPEKYVEVFIKSGANSVSVHCEVCPDIPKMAKMIRDLGARASIGVNPETPIDRVIAAAEHLDMILIMSVHPGFGGQEFIPASLQKLREVRRELKRRGLIARRRDRRRSEVGQHRRGESGGRQCLRLGVGNFRQKRLRRNRHGDARADRAHAAAKFLIADC